MVFLSDRSSQNYTNDEENGKTGLLRLMAQGDTKSKKITKEEPLVNAN